MLVIFKSQSMCTGMNEVDQEPDFQNQIGYKTNTVL